MSITTAPRCRDCGYLSRLGTCDYILIERRRRPCGPGAECTVHMKRGDTVKTASWDTSRARVLRSEGKPIAEIAEAVGVPTQLVRSFFSRVDKAEKRLGAAPPATDAGADVPQEPTAAPRPLMVHDAAELLYALDQLYPGATLRCGTGEDHFYGLELSLHIREGQEGPDVTVWLK